MVSAASSDEVTRDRALSHTGNGLAHHCGMFIFLTVTPAFKTNILLVHTTGVRIIGPIGIGEVQMTTPHYRTKS